MTQRKLLKALKNQKSKTQQTIQEFYGTLGIPLNGQQLVNVPERSNYVYVRMRDNQNEVIQAFNNTVATSYDLPVIVRRDGTHYSILGVNTARYQNTWNVVAPYLPNHGNTHSFSDSGGGDISWMFSRQFMPALVYPTSVTTGTNLFIAGYNLLSANNVWRYIGNTGTLDLMSYKPTGSTQSQMVLLYLDTISGNPGILTATGSYIPNFVTGAAEVLRYVPTPTLPSSQIPLAGVRLDTGTSAVSWDNIYDVRQWIHATPSGTASGGSSGVDTIGFAGLVAGVPIGTGTILNVIGAGATFSRSGTMFNLNVPGGGGGGGVDQIGVFGLNNGVPLGTGTIINFGNGFTTSISGTTLNPKLAYPATGTVVIWDEGVLKGSVTTLNFVGSNVDASVSGSVARIFVTGSAGGGGTPGGADTQIQFNNAGAFDGAEIGYTGGSNITLHATDQTVADTDGKPFVLRGADGNNDGNGGDIYITAGDNPSGNFNGGSIYLSPGNGDADGFLILTKGKIQSPDTGLFLRMYAGNNAVGTGGEVTIYGGDSASAGSGGNVLLYPGATAGGGVDGNVGIVNPTTGKTAYLDTSVISADRIFTFPDQAGTFELVNKNVATLSGDTTLDGTYDIVLVSGTTTITLPAAASYTGKIYNIKRTGTNTVTIARTGADTIDGAASLSLTVQYQSYTVVSNGTNWYII